MTLLAATGDLLGLYFDEHDDAQYVHLHSGDIIIKLRHTTAEETENFIVTNRFLCYIPKASKIVMIKAMNISACCREIADV